MLSKVVFKINVLVVMDVCRDLNQLQPSGLFVEESHSQAYRSEAKR